VSGDTTSGGVSRISKALEVSSPDFVLIELGGNDALRGYPVEKIKNNLLKIIDTAFKAKAKPIIMQIRIPPNYGKNYVAAFESIYSEIAEEKNIPLLTFLLEKIALEDDYFVSKKLYPNVDFYSGIVQRALGIPNNMFTCIFALARTVGWVAQWNEMIADPEQKIGRPRQLYVGNTRRDVVALDER